MKLLQAVVIIFFNPILFLICSSTFSKMCKQRIQWHVEECSVANVTNRFKASTLIDPAVPAKGNIESRKL
jgi:hypothetical protein